MYSFFVEKYSSFMNCCSLLNPWHYLSTYGGETLVQITTERRRKDCPKEEEEARTNAARISPSLLDGIADWGWESVAAAF